jgi:hypothetical protein
MTSLAFLETREKFWVACWGRQMQRPNKSLVRVALEYCIVHYGQSTSSSKVCIMLPPKIGGDKMQTFELLLYRVYLAVLCTVQVLGPISQSHCYSVGRATSQPKCPLSSRLLVTPPLQAEMFRSQ